MLLAEWDHVVQTLPPHCSDQPFTERIRLRCLHRRAQHLQTEGLHLLVYFRRKDRIAIVNQKPMVVIAGKGLAKLLQRPARSRMCRHVEVQDFAAPHVHNHKHIEHSKSGRDRRQEITGHEGLRFRGLTGYEGHCVRMKPGKDKINAVQQAMNQLVSTADLIRSRGLPVEIVSAGGTGTYSISGRIPRVTEIQAGSYPLMDTDYHTVCADFDLALSVLGTVISRTRNERLVLDIGLKEISGERGLPVLKHLEGARLSRLNAEHAIVDILDPHLPVQVGDQVEVWAHYSDATVNLHRQMFGVRDGRIEDTFLLES
jgi:hypothetical protein